MTDVIALPVSVSDVCARVLMNIGACGPYAHFVARFEPPGAGGGPELLSAVPEDRLPPEFLPSVRAGLSEGLDGVAAAVLLTDGSFHAVDSSEYGYVIAGREAGRAALIGAGLLPAEEADALRWTTWPGKPRPKKRRAAGRR